MTREEIQIKMVSAKSSISYKKLRKNIFLKDDEKEKISNSINEMKRLNHFHAIENKYQIRQMMFYIKRYRPKVVFIDYAQMMTSEDKSDVKTYQVEDIVKKLKIIAKQYKCCVVLGCQIDRRNTYKKILEYSMTDFKDSSSYEQVADIGAFLYWPWYLRRSDTNPETKRRWTERDKYKSWFLIRKHRYGETANIPLYFDFICGKFGSWSSEEDESIGEEEVI